MPELYRIIKFKRNCGSCGGSLVQFQAGDAEANALPFSIGKVLVMSDIRVDDVRGMHAHYETEEILVVLTGGCTIDLDNGKGLHESVRLTSHVARSTQHSEIRGLTADIRLSTSVKEALLLYPHVWRIMRSFEPDTTLMVVANMKYDEVDYIRDRIEFERIAKGWDGLGGSSAI